jgi:hypothetical protein
MSRAAKVAIGVLSVAVLAIVILVVVLVEHVGESKLTASKRVTPDAIKRFDTIVVLPATASAFTVSHVEDRMNRLGAVDRYAEVSHRSLTYLLSTDNSPGAKRLLTSTCAAPTTRGYVASLTRPTSASRSGLTAALRGDATVLPSSYEPPKTEIFMKVRATAAQAQAVQARLDRDPDVDQYTFLSHRDAYNQFRKLFADQQQLITSEPADGSGLPESFRLDLREGASPNAVVARYHNLSGVDEVLTPTGTGIPASTLFDVCQRG